MRRMRLACAALLVGLAAGTAGATPALAALPEFITSGGKTFEITGGSTILETRAGFRVACGSQSASGEVEASGSKKARKILMILKGCVSLSQKCQSFMAAAGEIRMNEMLGELGYVTVPPSPTVGLDLKPTGSGGFAIFECGTLGVAQVVGSVIGGISPLNMSLSASASFSLSFTQSMGKQGITHFASLANDIPETAINEGKFEESGFAVADKLKPTSLSNIEVKG
jgi:hypothetical protein